MDNYISLVSGQSPSYATQDDCSTSANMTNNNSGIITTGTVGTATDTDHTTDGSGPTPTAPNATAADNGNYGQLLVHGGVDAPRQQRLRLPDRRRHPVQPVQRRRRRLEGLRPGPRRRPARRSTTYVTGSTPGVTDTVPGRDDGACGYPGQTSNDPVTNPTNLVAPSGDVSSFTGAQPANANSNGDPADQYVAKHFPTGWFTSLTGESAGTQNGVTYPAQPALNQPTAPEYDGPGAPTNGTADTNCDANHVANLDDPTYGLAHDLTLPANQVPAFNWITPNNCSDAHDATCQGNNLSGAFNANGTPNYTPAGLPADDPEATTPTNYTGGLYASDLFLRYYIPLIEQSARSPTAGSSTSPSTRPTRRSPSATASTTCRPPATAPSSRRRPTSRPSARPGPSTRAPTPSTAPTACWPTPPVRTSTATT